MKYKDIFIYYDLETTGVNVKKHGIRQISMIIEIDGQIVEELDFKVRPNPLAIIDPMALKVSNVTEEEVLNYPPMEEVYKKVKKVLDKYVDRFDNKDKMWLIGFNNRAFDDPFFRAWFEQNKDNFFNSYFWPDSWDVLVMASVKLRSVRRDMINFKLKRVAKEFGIEIDETQLHDSLYDVRLTREIFRIIMGWDLL
ncbi:MAG: 3'-5' exonuclease [Fusobacteriaceae bacterium]